MGQSTQRDKVTSTQSFESIQFEPTDLQQLSILVKNQNDPLAKRLRGYKKWKRQPSTRRAISTCACFGFMSTVNCMKITKQA